MSHQSVPAPAPHPRLVLLHSPLTGPQAWGRLPDALAREGHAPLVVDVRDDDRAPFAGRYVARVALQVESGLSWAHQPVVLVAHSGAGPLLPAVGFAQAAARRSVTAYVFCDAGLPSPRASSRLRLMEAEDRDAARELHEQLDAGAGFPCWSDADLVDIVPDPTLRADLLASVRPRGHDFFTEALPGAGDWPDAPCAYLRTSSAYDVHARSARRRGWPVLAHDSGHFASLVEPEAVARSLLRLVSSCR